MACEGQTRPLDNMSVRRASPPIPFDMWATLELGRCGTESQSFCRTSGHCLFWVPAGLFKERRLLKTGALRSRHCNPFWGKKSPKHGAYISHKCRMPELTWAHHPFWQVLVLLSLAAALKPLHPFKQSPQPSLPTHSDPFRHSQPVPAIPLRENSGHHHTCPHSTLSPLPINMEMDTSILLFLPPLLMKQSSSSFKVSSSIPLLTPTPVPL